MAYVNHSPNNFILFYFLSSESFPSIFWNAQFPESWIKHCIYLLKTQRRTTQSLSYFLPRSICCLHSLKRAALSELSPQPSPCHELLWGLCPEPACHSIWLCENTLLAIYSSSTQTSRTNSTMMLIQSWRLFWQNQSRRIFPPSNSLNIYVNCVICLFSFCICYFRRQNEGRTLHRRGILLQTFRYTCSAPDSRYNVTKKALRLPVCCLATPVPRAPGNHHSSLCF